MNYKAVVFDLDGTLLDTIEDLADSMNIVLQNFGWPIHSTDAYKLFVGDGMEQLVRRALPSTNCDETTVAKILSGMRAEYSVRQTIKTRPYQGIKEMLDGLVERGIKINILSNKPDDFTKQLVSALLSVWSFDVVQGVKSDGIRKPNPAGAIDISKKLNIAPEQFLYLGDTGTDMQTACAAGMSPIGVLWGFRSADELKANGAKKLINNPLDLLELV